MAGFIDALGMGIAGAAGGTIVGEVGKAFGIGGNQAKEQQVLSDMQEKANTRLMGRSYALQKEMYNHTYRKNTPEQQVANLKAAGLNPALMYGTGGGGVTNTATGGGGASVGGATASGTAERTNAQTAQMGMALQLAKLKSEVDVNESIAESNRVNAAKTSGVDTTKATTEIEKLKADTANIEVQTGIANIEKTIKMFSAADQVNAIETNAKILGEELEKLNRENRLGEETYNNLVDEVRARAVNEQLDNNLKKIGINLTEAQIKSVTEGVQQRWTEIGISKEGVEIGKEGNQIRWEQLSNEQQQTAIKLFEAELSKDQPGIQQVGGKILDRVIEPFFDARAAAERYIGFGKGRNWRLEKK